MEMKYNKFHVGQRVIVDLKDVPADEHNCDIGQIVSIHLYHRNSPLERVEYLVRFDKPYIKPEKVLYQNINCIQTMEDTLRMIRE